ncbi:MAG TPA: lysophospholipid acyltransferase family protein [Gemmatimonadaceae bacterium]|nr:lysophospholipid acyltransferase family protein [Gemmatimonadaceae bacterium]
MVTKDNASLLQRAAALGRLAGGWAGFSASLGVAAATIAAGASRQTITSLTASRMSRWTRAGGRIRLSVTGREHVTCDPCVYVANHQSFLDYPLMATIFPQTCIVVARESIHRMPVVGFLYKRSGHAVIHRESTTSAAQTLEHLAARIRRERVPVWMFPEGTRNKGDPRVLQPFRIGAFRLAVDAGVPVVPVVLSPLRPVIDLEGWWVGPSAPTLQVLAPEPPVGTPRELADRVRACMQSVLTDA